MRNFDGLTFLICAGAVLAGCGGSQNPISAPGTASQSHATGGRSDFGKSWMLPEAAGDNLLYVDDRNTVTVYSYPKGKLVGKLTGFGILGGNCTDKAGNVWVLDNQNAKVVEFEHGGTSPISTLSPQYEPTYCSVNPKTGDLAVGTGQEVLLIYPHAAGNPASYTDSPVEGFLASAYDTAGNLFIACLSTNYKFAFVELPDGGNALRTIALNQSFEFPGGVAVVGPNVAVGDADTGAVYRFKIAGSAGTEVGSTQLQFGSSQAFEFAIHRDRLIAPLDGSFFNAVQYFDYPAGGSATKTIENGIASPVSVTLSLAQ